MKTLLRSNAKKILRQTSVRQMLFWIISISIVGLALLSAVANSWEAGRRHEEFLIKQGMSIAEGFAGQSILALLYRSADNGKAPANATLSNPSVIAVSIVDVTGKAVLTMNDPGLTPDQDTPAIRANTSEVPALEYETPLAWHFTAPVIRASEVTPFDMAPGTREILGHVRVAVSKQSLYELKRQFVIFNVIISLMFAAVLLWVITILARYIVRPLAQVSSLMGDAQRGRSGIRAYVDGPRDLTDMSTAFNRMMEVLEEREAALKTSRDEATKTAIAKSQFAATVSHEVRTPLNGVVGMLEMLKQTSLTKKQREYVDTAWNSSHALIELTSDILDFSKIEAGRLALNEIEFDVDRLLTEVLALSERAAAAKGIVLHYDRSIFVPDRLIADELRLRQVLSNLVSNAVKFTPSGIVTVRLIASDQTEDGLTLRCEVHDTGIGIASEALSRIFESYEQASGATASQYGGTGLGLSICKQLIHLMQGDIGVDSQEGHGSTFWFTVRCKGVLTQIRTAHDELFPKRVLVAGNDDAIRAFVSQTLVEKGVACDVVGSHDQAVLELKRAIGSEAPYDMLIVDLDTVYEYATDLVLRIRSDDLFANLKIMMLSRHQKMIGQNQGNEAFIGRPLTTDRLIDAITGLQCSDRHPIDTGATSEGLRLPTTRRILVAEDNRTNQVVAAGMLDALGWEYEIAVTGRAAVRAVGERHFDLILMDCSMPDMDGFEATTRIRSNEYDSGRRIPIVAMTANASASDAEKCRSVGMDDFLAKPMTMESLKAVLDKFLPTSDNASPSEPVMASDTSGADATSVLDREIFSRLRTLLGPALRNSIEHFIEDTPVYLKQLETAYGQQALETVQSCAHSIKGSSGHLGLKQLGQLAKQVEQLIAAGQPTEIASVIPQLRAAFEMASEALQAETFTNEIRAAQERRPSINVLVVDDDRSTRNALRVTLEHEGFFVVEAEDGEKALSMLKQVKPDIILMDGMMPVMDGFTACAKLQETAIGRATPVLMVTSLEDPAAVERALAAGASDFISKPIHFAVLAQRIRRIFEANQAEQAAKELASNDHLTGLPNRAIFFEQLGMRIDHARKHSERFAVIYLDLDRFKYINDTMGHAAGDQVLTAVANRMRRTVLGTDCIARIGGDEFTVVLSDSDDLSNVAHRAQELCAAISQVNKLNSEDFYVTASAGIAIYPGDGQNVGDLLKRAETAMYRAKKKGNTFEFFELGMERSISEQVRMENDLRQAVDHKSVTLCYQPKVRVSTGEVIGMEALARWHHALRGPVSPAEFIPLAEETGLIYALGEHLLRTACNQVREWVDAGMNPIPVSVNLSARQVLHADFLTVLDGALRDSGLAPQLLELEITESMLIEHQDTVRELLGKIKQRGVKLSIDDFGTGYSSLGYLKNFPIDALKIDRSFIRDVPHEQDDASIVKTIMALAHTLRLEVVAEGVETDVQLDFLKEIGCQVVQGYLFGRPMNPEVFFSSVVEKNSVKA